MPNKSRFGPGGAHYCIRREADADDLHLIDGAFVAHMREHGYAPAAIIQYRYYLVRTADWLAVRQRKLTSITRHEVPRLAVEAGERTKSGKPMIVRLALATDTRSGVTSKSDRMRIRSILVAIVTLRNAPSSRREVANDESVVAVKPVPHPAALLNSSSRMSGNHHVWFYGEGVGATRPLTQESGYL